jgi:hypothetical protein
MNTSEILRALSYLPDEELALIVAHGQEQVRKRLDHTTIRIKDTVLIVNPDAVLDDPRVIRAKVIGRKLRGNHPYAVRYYTVQYRDGGRTHRLEIHEDKILAFIPKDSSRPRKITAEHISECAREIAADWAMAWGGAKGNLP